MCVHVRACACVCVCVSVKDTRGGLKRGLNLVKHGRKSICSLRNTKASLKKEFPTLALVS